MEMFNFDESFISLDKINTLSKKDVMKERPLLWGSVSGTKMCRGAGIDAFSCGVMKDIYMILVEIFGKDKLSWYQI